MKDLITIRGFIASDITESTTSSGNAAARFRCGVTDRHFNKENEQWEDGHTNWFTVHSYRNLAVNARQSLRKGQRVLIVGKLRIIHYEKDSTTWVNPEIEAEAIGHDLTWGTSTYSRNTNKQHVGLETTPRTEQPANTLSDRKAAVVKLSG